MKEPRSDCLFSCRGGQVLLPPPALVLVSREDGGNLIVNPPRPVWERGQLTREELIDWSFLVAATGQAMLEALPQLAGGCINYWEAGNWALHADAEPRGIKRAPDHRRVHLHLLGRGPDARDPSWTWGEAPQFPRFSERLQWASGRERLSRDECVAVVAALARILIEKYGMPLP